LSREVSRRLPAALRALRQARLDQLIERVRRRRLERGHGRRLAFENRANQARLASAVERFVAGQHLVQHRTEREDVGADIGFLPFQLLGRHVLEGANDRAGACQG
jgi:hypothetical protein